MELTTSINRCAEAVSSRSNFSVVPWVGAASNATQFSRQELLNKHSRYITMKGFRLSIARHLQTCNFLIIHPCGILLLTQAHPKMPCIYTSYFNTLYLHMWLLTPFNKAHYKAHCTCTYAVCLISHQMHLVHFRLAFIVQVSTVEPLYSETIGTNNFVLSELRDFWYNSGRYGTA